MRRCEYFFIVTSSHIKAYHVVQAGIGKVHVRIKLLEADTNVST